MPQTTEFLKSLRLFYGVLMTLSTAIFVFVLTPDNSAKYRSALTELATLSQVNSSSYLTFVHARLQDVEDHESQRILAAGRNAGLSIPKPVRYSLPVTTDRPPNNNDLLQCDAFFGGNQSLAPLVIDSSDDDLAKRIRDEALRQHISGERLVTIQLRDPGGMTEASGGTVISPDNPANKNWRGILEFVFEGDSPIMAPKNVQIVVILVRGSARYGPFGLEWLQRDPVGKSLIDPKTGTIFPHLKPFWNQFGMPMRADTVAEYLQQQLQSLKGGTVSFFGISVSGALMVAIGPIVCFVTLLYFQLVFSRFVLLASFDDASIMEFPWVPLFPGQLARTAAYASFCFPLFANLWLVLKYGVWTEGPTWIGFVGMILLSVVSIWAVVCLSRLHSKMKLNSHA